MLGLLLVTLIAVIVILAHIFRDPLAKLKFDQIECGMTRKQVRELMRNIPGAEMYPAKQADVWILGGHYWVLATYSPNYDVEPGIIDPRDAVTEDWTVEEAFLEDISDRGLIRKWLEKFGLSSSDFSLHKRCK
jgi:hypothetical protein